MATRANGLAMLVAYRIPAAMACAENHGPSDTRYSAIVTS